MPLPFLDIPSQKITTSVINPNPILSDHYRPNFVLIDEKHKNFPFFSDILISYTISKPLAEIVFTSWESLLDFALFSQTFFICILAIIKTAFRNSVYQLYLVSESLYSQVSQIPSISSKTYNSLLEVKNIFNSSQNRELWWLDLKLNIRLIQKTISKILADLYYFTSKFYLAGVVGVSILTLQSTTINSLPTKSDSFLGKFIQQNILNTTNSNFNDYSSLTFTDTTNLVEAENDILWIGEYTTVSGDTPVVLAKDFNLSLDSVLVNNNLKIENANTNFSSKTNVLIPFIDGYIFSAETNLDIKQILENTKVDQDLFNLVNQDYLKSNPKILKKGDLLFIPGTNPQKLREVLIKYQTGVIELQKVALIEESKKTRKSSSYVPIAKSLSRKDTRYKAALNHILSLKYSKPIHSYRSRSRCIRPGHNGVDLATPKGTPIYAMFDGLLTNSYEPRGGNYIKIVNTYGDKLVYAHLSEFLLPSGTMVTAGQLIGKTGGVPGEAGSGGATTGAHLHFEIQSQGIYVDACDVFGY
jgi:murein DD-endopeptidase MepM/ murein hydrolase activator NlpD